MPAATSAEQSHGSCLAPDVVGVSLKMATHALVASGCHVMVRQLPGHGEFVAPKAPDGRQLVGRQSPHAGNRSNTVTIWLKPLCVQSAQPGPTDHLPAVSRGPTELISGLFLRGGPLLRAPRCRRGTPSAGTVTVAAAEGGRIIARRSVGAGRYAVFPLSPGRYLVGGTFASATRNGRPIEIPPVSVTISAHRTTRRNVVAEIP